MLQRSARLWRPRGSARSPVTRLTPHRPLKRRQLVGTGATFPFPLISKWIPELGKAYGINVTYSPTGSGAGIAAITARTVDFGASDAPLSAIQLDACKGCVVIPWALSATSIPYNLPGLNGRLRLDGPTLANIYLGKITQWNDAAIKALNPKLEPAGHEDHAGLPLRRLGHDLQLHRVPLVGQLRVQERRSATARASAGRRGVGARGSSGVAGVVSKTAVAR